MSPNLAPSTNAPETKVYDSWCVCVNSGHSCVNVANQTSPSARKLKMFWKIPGLLVERFFDKKRVVGDLEGRRALGGRTANDASSTRATTHQQL